MDQSIKDAVCTMRVFAIVFVAFLYVFSASAEDESSDIQTYLPLFERNSLGRKILDVRYLHKYEKRESGVKSTGTQEERLVFDVETGKYREEIKEYNNPNDTNAYAFTINTWDGNRFVTWTRHFYQKQGVQSFGGSLIESPGVASIRSEPCMPLFMDIYYLGCDRPLSKVISDKNSQLSFVDGDIITIETIACKFFFSKKTGALKKIICFTPKSPPDGKEMMIWKTFNLSGHVECSGFLIPTRVMRTFTFHNIPVEIDAREEYAVIPQTLRMVDVVDGSLFSEVLPAGCAVNDEIEKRVYTVTIVDAMSKNVEEVRKSLEKILKQAEDQKADVDKNEKKEKRRVK